MVAMVAVATAAEKEVEEKKAARVVSTRCASTRAGCCMRSQHPRSLSRIAAGHGSRKLRRLASTSLALSPQGPPQRRDRQYTP